MVRSRSGVKTHVPPVKEKTSAAQIKSVATMAEVLERSGIFSPRSDGYSNSESSGQLISERSRRALSSEEEPKTKTRNRRKTPSPEKMNKEALETPSKCQTDDTVDDNEEGLERRNIDSQPCGLLNFGNFCYVNSFLQIWFNDLVFRQCVYDWRAEPDFIPDDSKMNIQAVMNTMQELFLTMQFTPLETASASELIRLLKLDNEQHDVQEFNMLFFQALDRNLKRHPNGEPVRKMLQTRFEARICQTISCTSCYAESSTNTLYSSLLLSVEGHKSLTDAIEAYFDSETLTDYKCGVCGNVGATRTLRFTKLPPVLIIQLNRYNFDTNGEHKKVKAAIQYPRTLPERVLKDDAPGDVDYELTAVMIHKGPNTHCGHYYDYIKSPVDNTWFKYNDKEVTKVRRPPGVVVEQKKVPITADMKESYALIYQRMGSSEGLSLDSLRLPPQVNELRKRLDVEFAEESKKVAEEIAAENLRKAEERRQRGSKKRGQNATLDEYIYVVLKNDESDDLENKNGSAPPRRRTPRKRPHKFPMSLTETIGDLKLKILEKLNYSPTDQLLLNGEETLDSSMTLEDAGISTNNSQNPLTLIVQVPAPGNDLPNRTPPRQLEKGFRDTALFD